MEKQVDELKEKYGEEGGIQLLLFNGKAQLGSNPLYKESVEAVLNPIREKELTRTILECAAIIAYKQPITKTEIEEDKAELIRALEEFRLIKEETKKLKEMETIGYFFKEPDKHVGETRTVFSLDNLTLDGLVNAFSKLLIKQEFAKAQDEVREIPRDEYTVEEKIQFVMESLESGENVRFEQLFTKDHTKSEIVTTFQAILELLKYQYLRVKQNETFGEIVISLNPDRKEEPIGTIDQYD